MEDTMQSTTAVSTPQDQIDELMKQAAEEVCSFYSPIIILLLVYMFFI
jgi:hypothetical protein